MSIIGSGILGNNGGSGSSALTPAQAEALNNLLTRIEIFNLWQDFAVVAGATSYTLTKTDNGSFIDSVFDVNKVVGNVRIVDADDDQMQTLAYGTGIIKRLNIVKVTAVNNAVVTLNKAPASTNKIRLIYQYQTNSIYGYKNIIDAGSAKRSEQNDILFKTEQEAQADKQELQGNIDTQEAQLLAKINANTALAIEYNQPATSVTFVPVATIKKYRLDFIGMSEHINFVLPKPEAANKGLSISILHHNKNVGVTTDQGYYIGSVLIDTATANYLLVTENNSCVVATFEVVGGDTENNTSFYGWRVTNDINN
jgi:hypothetical protein